MSGETNLIETREREREFDCSLASGVAWASKGCRHCTSDSRSWCSSSSSTYQAWCPARRRVLHTFAGVGASSSVSDFDPSRRLAYRTNSTNRPGEFSSNRWLCQLAARTVDLRVIEVWWGEHLLRWRIRRTTTTRCRISSPSPCQSWNGMLPPRQARARGRRRPVVP